MQPWKLQISRILGKMNSRYSDFPVLDTCVTWGLAVSPKTKTVTTDLFLDMNSLIFFTQVMLSIYMLPYSLYSLAYWIYPLKDYIGVTGCYVAIYGRDIGNYIAQTHSFFMAIFLYNCLFNGIFLRKINVSPNVSSCFKSDQTNAIIITTVSYCSCLIFNLIIAFSILWCIILKILQSILLSQIFAKFMAMLNFLMPIFSWALFFKDNSSVLQECLGKGYNNFLSTKPHYCSYDNSFLNIFCWTWLCLMLILLSNIVDAYCLFCCGKHITKSTEETKHMLSKEAYINRKRYWRLHTKTNETGV